LVLPLSEPAAALPGSNVLQWLQPAWVPTSQSGQSLTISGDSLFLYFASSAPTLCPAPGDSVRLMPSGSVGDRYGNVPGATPLSVVVQGGVRPPLFAWMLDTNGDGSIESAVVQFSGPVRGAIPQLTFTLGGSGAATSRIGQAALDPLDSTKVLVSFAQPFPFGLTGFVGAQDGDMAGGWPFDLRDSVPPVVVSANVHLTESYSDPDTLVVVGSEPLRLDATMPWVSVKQKGAIADLPGTARQSLGDTLLFLMYPDDPLVVSAGDSIRFVSSGAVADTSGNVPPSYAIWVRVTGGVRKPLSKLIPPVPLVRLDRSQPGPSQTGAIVLQAAEADTSDWALWTSEAGYGSGEICPQGVCNGPELVINSPVRVGAYIYDNLGVHVAESSWDIDSTSLANLQKDRLGRARVRLSWDYRTSGGARVADGIYIIRLVLMVPSVDGTEPRVINQTWKIGLGPLLNP
jgi:hypothetical protein